MRNKAYKDYQVTQNERAKLSARQKREQAYERAQITIRDCESLAYKRASLFDYRDLFSSSFRKSVMID
jgi:hypothetical protein